MSDLISRQAVIEVLKQTGSIADDERGNLVVAEIERIPAAYDVDKVIEQIGELNDNEFALGKVSEIIRAGGIDEERI